MKDGKGGVNQMGGVGGVEDKKSGRGMGKMEMK